MPSSYLLRIRQTGKSLNDRKEGGLMSVFTKAAILLFSTVGKFSVDSEKYKAYSNTKVE